MRCILARLVRPVLHGMTLDRGQFKPQSRVFRDGMLKLSIDGRSRLGRYLRTLRAELIEHVAGPRGSPGVVQAQLIDLAVSDAHQLMLFAERALKTGKLSLRERREESAARGRYERTLARLGLMPAKAKNAMTALEYGRLVAAQEAAEQDSAA
jgi:hypothetical protein